jgi:hypothetical protein
MSLKFYNTYILTHSTILYNISYKSLFLLFVFNELFIIICGVTC